LKWIPRTAVVLEGRGMISISGNGRERKAEVKALSNNYINSIGNPLCAGLARSVMLYAAAGQTDKAF